MNNFNPAHASAEDYADYILNGGYVMGGVDNPTDGLGKPGTRGSIWIQVGIYGAGAIGIWQKQDDGVSPNWTPVGGGGGGGGDIRADGTVPFAANQSMGGFLLTSLGAPIDPNDAANKAYVDAADAAVLAVIAALEASVIKKDGSVAFEGNQSMGGNLLTDLADPIVATDAVNKGYVDAAILNLKFENLRYVSKNGSDLTGDGSVSRPYLTIVAAMAGITDASPSKRYIIFIEPGQYDEIALTLKANVSLCGYNFIQTRVSSTAPITPDASFTAAGDNRTGIYNINVLTAMNYNMLAVSGNEGKFFATGSQFAQGLTLTAFSNINQGFLRDCDILGPGYVQNGWNSTVQNCRLSAVVVNERAAGNTILNGAYSTVNANTAINGTSQTISVTLDEFRTAGTFNASGSSTTVRASIDSLPAVSTFTGGAVKILTSQGQNVNYVPTIPTDWSVAPQNVKAAIDELAARVSLHNPVEIYVDASVGSDLTGNGSMLRPYQSLPQAITHFTAAPAGNYVVELAPGEYNGAPIAWPALAGKNLSINGSGAGQCRINHLLSFTAAGTSDEVFVFDAVSVSNPFVVDLAAAAATVSFVILQNGQYNVTRVDTNPPGPTFVKITDSFVGGFDLASVCLMQNCQWVGGTMIVQATGYAFITDSIAAQMNFTVDGNLALFATNAQGSTFTGTGTLSGDASSLLNTVRSGPSINYLDQATNVGFTPATPADWVNPPVEVAAALDELAGRIQASAVNLDQVVFVAKNGNDGSADGSMALPYLTIEAAIQSITDAADNKKYVVAVAPGTYVEPTISIKPNIDVAVFNLQIEASDITAIDAGLVLDASWNTGSSNTRTVFAGFQFYQSGTIDNTGVGGSGAIKFSNCSFNGLMTFIDPTGQMALLGNEATFNGGADITGFVQVNGRFRFQGASSFTAVPGVNTIFVIDGGIVVGGAFTATAGPGDSANVFFRNTQVIGAFGGSLVLDGDGIIFLATVDSYPAASDITIVGNPTLGRLSDAWGLGYVPVAPAEWKTPPIQVAEALDALTARKTVVETRSVTATEATNKQLLLSNIPYNVNNISLTFGGIEQTGGGVDFSVSGIIVSWTGLGMDFIGVAENDLIVLTYMKE